MGHKEFLLKYYFAQKAGWLIAVLLLDGKNNFFFPQTILHFFERMDGRESSLQI